MPNNENDPLSLPIVGQEALVMGESNILVAATVAAVVLAGSALVYRHAANASSKHRPQKGWLLNPSSTLENHLDMNKQGGGAIDSQVGTTAAPTSTAAHTLSQEVDVSMDTNSAQVKSPRSKDRRRRGKDPLKEALKNGKKLRTTATTNPPPNPALSSGLDSLSFKEEPFVSAGPSTSFQALDPGSSQSAIPPEAPPSQQGPSKRRQRFKSSATTFAAPDTDTTMSCVSGHSSEASHSIPEAEDEEPVAAGFDEGPFRSNYKPFSPQSQSLTQTSDSSARSSVTDGSELDPESEGWMTSGSKSRSRNRTRLADVLFEDALVGPSSKVNVDQNEEATSTSPREHENTAADSSLTPIPTVNPMKGHWPDVESVDVETELRPSPLPPPLFGSKAMTNSNLHVLPPSDDPSSPERNKNKSQTQQQEPSPWDWGGTGPTPVSSALDDSIDEISNPELKNGDEDDEMTPVSISRTKGPTGRTNFSSFSSALVEGGGGLGTCRTVGVSIADPSSSPPTGSIEVVGSAFSLGEDKEEFTFPTLNPLPSSIASGPNRTRSPSNYDTVNSSPSKKSRKGGKNNVLPSNPASSKSTFHRETRYNTGHGNPINLDGVIAAQTQLASLKGALEAARQREEKHKEEMEKAMKDMEVLKWEGTNSRRGEAELQAQVRHLTDQLQSYATLFATMAPHLAPHIAAAQYLHQTQRQPQMKANENTDSLSDPESNPTVDPHSPQSPDADEIASDRPSTPPAEEVEPKKEPPESMSSLTADNELVPSTPSQSQIQQTPALSPPPPQLNGVASPLHASGHPLSPPPSAAVPSTFFPYGMSPYVHALHPHLPVQPFTWLPSPYQRQQMQAHGVPQSPNQPPFPSIFPPMMYPMSPVASPLTHHYAYGNGSAGTSSAGSYSPELSGSPRLGMNGKNRPRMKKKKANVMNNGNARTSWEDVGDAYIGLNGIASSSDAFGEQKGKNQTLEIPTSAEFEVDDDGESSSPYSELLADAILKRPSSIRPPSVGPLQKDAKKADGALEEQKHDKSDQVQHAEAMEQLTEFTFPSLSDFGGGSGSYYRAASRTESSISSSLSCSPPSTTTTIPDSIGDPKGEDDRPSLAPVIENDDLDIPSGVGVQEGDAVQKNKPNDVSTPTQDTMVTAPS